MEKLPHTLAALALFFGAFCLLSCHQHAVLEESPFIHFQDEEIIQLTICTDMGKLLADGDDPEYQPAKLSLEKNGQPVEHFHIKTKARGVFRKSMCTFPPLKIRFPDKVLKETGLDEFPTLKLVTHCKEDSIFEQLILKEYLTFKLYNVLTDSSFRTQLARIRYVDDQGKMPDVERYGFIIESPEELAERLEGRLLGEEFGVPKHINKPQYKLFTMFQFMIGNTDWALKNRHNVKLIQPKDGDLRLPIPVPYDFDFCGLVDAPYAVPHHSIPVADVKDRFFQWRGSQDEDFSEVIALFKSKKTELMAVCNKCEFLTETCKAEATAYLDSFFEVIDEPEKMVELNAAN